MKYKTLTLLLTYNCNLACDYCFCGKKKTDNMSEATAKKAIDFFMKNADETVNLVFFGGEPLIQAELIKKLIHYCKENYGERVNYCMTTNGTLLNRENVDMIVQNNIAVTLSVDGMSESHDLHRRFVDGRPSWNIIMDNLRNNHMNKANITLRLTFTKHNVKELAHNIISLHNLGFQRLAFYPAADIQDMFTERDIEEFQEQIDRLITYTYQCYRDNKPINVHWINRSINSHINGGCARCMDGVTQMAITPEGNIYPCNRVDFSENKLCLGNIKDGIEQKKLEWYKAEITKVDPECEGCWLKKRCQGCHIENFTMTGKSWEIPWHYCVMNQYVIKKSDELADKLYFEKNKYFMQVYYPEKCE